MNELPMNRQFRVGCLIVQEAQFGVKTGFVEVHIGYIQDGGFFHSKRRRSEATTIPNSNITSRNSKPDLLSAKKNPQLKSHEVHHPWTNCCVVWGSIGYNSSLWTKALLLSGFLLITMSKVQHSRIYGLVMPTIIGPACIIFLGGPLQGTQVLWLLNYYEVEHPKLEHIFATIDINLGSGLQFFLLSIPYGPWA